MTSRTGNKRSNRAEKSCRRAFTLVELMLVMTILTVVIAVASPTLANFFRGRALDSEARRLLALTRLAQSRAVYEGVPMVLWVDAKQRSYGVEEESGYTDLVEAKATEYQLNDDLEVEVVTSGTTSGVNSLLGGNRFASATAIEKANALRARSRSAHRNLPSIRFQPDGTFSETSAQTLRLFDRNGDTLWLALSRNRESYEIRSQTNQFNQWEEVTR
ncbi:MAG: GspH/FimT family pseudopilin [Verrucomicrobia bacterium]|nr:GspH/FimT family pseudopilin [Verrucomicrobiota bacterium]